MEGWVVGEEGGGMGGCVRGWTGGWVDGGFRLVCQDGKGLVPLREVVD